MPPAARKRWRCTSGNFHARSNLSVTATDPDTKTTSTTPEASCRRRRRMLPFAGSIFPARRLWLKALTRCESPASLLAAAQARRATHTGPSSSKGPKSSSPPNRRRRRRLPESAREVLEARLDARHLTPEHVEAMRHLSSVFSDEDPNKLHVRPDGFVPVSRVVRRLSPNTLPEQTLIVYVAFSCNIR